jgi:catechol 2,3-dioxygenase
LGRFVRHLHDIGAYFGSSDHYVSEALYLTDPDGLGIEVYADRSRTTWRVQQRQLAMASEPLDLDDLIRAGGETAWSGMPPGTIMGHVHLYVGDLDQAATFYHAGLGMDKIVWSYPGALFMSAGGYHHHLGTNTWAAGATVATEDDARMLEWNVLVTDATSAGQAARSIQALGYAVESDGDSWVATDPWGVRVRIGIQ